MVVGGGAAGCAVALALRERDQDVTVVERGPIGAGATGASGGMLAPQYEAGGPSPLFRLAVRAREEWPAFAERVEARSGRLVHREVGGMLVRAPAPEDVPTLRAVADWQRAEGLRAELLEPEDVRRFQPGLGRAAAWLWLPDEARVDAQALGGALGAALAAAGAVLRTGTPVAAVRATGSSAAGVLLEGGEELPAGRVVIAAGAWSGRLRGLPRSVPIRPVRGQMIRYPNQAPELARLVADPAGRYLVPRADGTLLAGSTMEEAGFEPAVTDEGLASIGRAARRLLPQLERARPLESWAGLRPVAADDLPVLGEDPEMEGLFWATGYGRDGILLAPLAGRLLADWMVGGSPPAELVPFGPGRFSPR